MERSHSARLGVRWSRWMTAMTLGAAASASHADGTPARTDAPPDHTASEYALTRSLNQADSLRLVGSYYLFDPARSSLGPLMTDFLGGFRASTGVVGALARPVSLFDVQREEAQSLPYVGVGYSHLWLTGQLSLNADLGLASQPTLSGGGHLRSLFGPQSFDDPSSDPRWGPVMAVNLRYAF